MRILHIGMMHIRMLFKGESLTLIKVQIQDLSSLILSCRFDGRRQLKFSTCVAFDTAVTRLAAAMFVHYLIFVLLSFYSFKTETVQMALVASKATNPHRPLWPHL